MKAKRRMSANDISNSSDLSNTFMVAITASRRDRRARRRLGACARRALGDQSQPAAAFDALVGSSTAWPERTVKSWPKARSKFERFSSSITSHWLSPDRLEEMAFLERSRRLGSGLRPPIVS